MQWLVNSRPCACCFILTIIANCVVMSMDTHLPNGDKTMLALQLVKCQVSSDVRLDIPFEMCPVVILMSDHLLQFVSIFGLWRWKFIHRPTIYNLSKGRNTD